MVLFWSCALVDIACYRMLLFGQDLSGEIKVDVQESDAGVLKLLIYTPLSAHL